jgi:hypothetical protein
MMCAQTLRPVHADSGQMTGKQEVIPTQGLPTIRPPYALTLRCSDAGLPI